MIEKEKSENQGDEKERLIAIDKLIYQNSPWRRTKKRVLSDTNPELSDYIKLPHPIIKKKLVHEDEAGMFKKFK